MSLSVNRLKETLNSLPLAGCCHLAFSGGLDSCVLLHLLSELRPQLPYPLRAIHVHHGLQQGADVWQNHCEVVCAKYDIPLDTLALELTPQKGQSLEAQAREARYEALAQRLNPGDLLLTAQHQDDQAETLLLQLLRGSGPAGLAAMPLITEFGNGWLARPLLQDSRESIEYYANAIGLNWQEDPSNQDERFDRNFIRHSVMPLLQLRWPAAAVTLSRAAHFTGEMLTLAKEEMDVELARVQSTDVGTLSITGLKEMSSIRVRHLLRHWIKSSGAPLPNSKKLLRIEHESIHGRSDSAPLVAWRGWEVRRYRDDLVLTQSHSVEPLPSAIPWIGKQQLQLPNGLGSLIVSSGEGGIANHYWQRAEIEIRFRKGGERCRPAGQEHHRPLKKLFQEWGVPPWERDRIPLVFLDGHLAAIPGRLICQKFSVPSGEEGVHVHWQTTA
ncbi:MAG: tRNA lysidine(34) synthetase TilS [Candidatus Thiodiazotropha sp. L084R]